MTKLYYTAPEDSVFEEVKKAAMSLWKEIDTDGDKYGYASEKISRIENIGNCADNLMYIVAMFDHINQMTLAEKLSPAARQSISERMKDGGQPDEYNPF